ncbi:MAG: type II secretion system major pseudopilin GspG [Candidatus Omnitrophica bacterium]|nr:type II secretion system major pseudopilin GspG [Candidatus Omnitrophota bacterium]MBU4333913.1 type II secretion system major pseudopilin GspG [Candidatus Omnitrophota bacterium]
MRSLRKQNKAFTLIEIMLVVIIIAALSAMVVPRLVGRSEQAKVSVAKSDINSQLATALKLYELDNGTFPSAEQGLVALRKKPSTTPEARNWNGPYIEKDPIDPWGSPYVYVSPGKKRPDYDLSSLGSDKNNSGDDINNWEE